jgi:hypothetical protein
MVFNTNFIELYKLHEFAVVQREIRVIRKIR